MQGTIKKLMPNGCGFIAVADSAKDLFFHSSSLTGVRFEDLKEGHKVVFDTEQTRRGVVAVNIRWP